MAGCVFGYFCMEAWVFKWIDGLCCLPTCTGPLPFLFRITSGQSCFRARGRIVLNCAHRATTVSPWGLCEHARRSCPSIRSRLLSPPNLARRDLTGGADRAPVRPQRGPHTGRGARTDGLVSDRTRPERSTALCGFERREPPSPGPPSHTGHFSSFHAISQNIHSYRELMTNDSSIRRFSSLPAVLAHWSTFLRIQRCTSANSGEA